MRGYAEAGRLVHPLIFSRLLQREQLKNLHQAVGGLIRVGPRQAGSGTISGHSTEEQGVYGKDWWVKGVNPPPTSNRVFRVFHRALGRGGGGAGKEFSANLLGCWDFGKPLKPYRLRPAYWLA